jgi:aryl-alcohol dehydrogenase-like predicted oxidoreductase
MIPTLPFGRTNHDSTRIIFGAAAFSSVDQDVADETMQLIIDHGINHIDVAHSYGDAEIRLGPWMETHRDRFFLATKTGERTADAAWTEICRSLERLKTDSVDLIQLHNLAEPEEQEIALGAGGALEACIRAKEEGLVRFIGVTGHGLQIAAMHKRSLVHFDFDSVLLPYNYPLMQNPQYQADFEELVTICLDRNVAIQTIKSITRAPWGDREQTTLTWYEPLEEQGDIDQAVWWVLGRPDVYLNTASDPRLLAMQLDAAERFATRPSDAEMAALLERQQMQPLFV